MLGYSKDHRPDLKQITVTMTQISDANIPIWFEALNGNSSDKKSFQETVKSMKAFQLSLTNMPDNIPFVVDAAFYTPESLKKLNQVTWLTRIPANYKAAKRWLTKADKAIEWVQVDADNKLHVFEVLHEGIEQRWALVDSKKGRARAEKTFFKQLEKTYDKHSKTLWHLCNQTFSCEADAEKRLLNFSKQLKYYQLHYQIIPVLKHPGRGRPKQGREAICVGYRCEATLASDMNKIKKELERLGRFILATNELNKERMPDEEILRDLSSNSKCNAFLFY